MNLEYRFFVVCLCFIRFIYLKGRRCEVCFMVYEVVKVEEGGESILESRGFRRMNVSNL